VADPIERGRRVRREHRRQPDVDVVEAVVWRADAQRAVIAERDVQRALQREVVPVVGEGAPVGQDGFARFERAPRASLAAVVGGPLAENAVRSRRHRDGFERVGFGIVKAHGRDREPEHLDCGLDGGRRDPHLVVLADELARRLVKRRDGLLAAFALGDVATRADHPVRRLAVGQQRAVELVGDRLALGSDERRLHRDGLAALDDRLDPLDDPVVVGLGDEFEGVHRRDRLVVVSHRRGERVVPPEHPPVAVERVDRVGDRIEGPLRDSAFLPEVALPAFERGAGLDGVDRLADRARELRECRSLLLAERVPPARIQRQHAVVGVVVGKREGDHRRVSVPLDDLRPRVERLVVGDVPRGPHFLGTQRSPDGTATAGRVVGPNRDLVEVRRPGSRALADCDSVAVVGLADPRERVRCRVGETRTDTLFDSLAGRFADEFALDLADHLVDPREFVRPLLGTVGLDRVDDPVGQQLVAFGPGPLLEVVGDAGRDRLAGDLLRPLAGEQHERDVGADLADRGEEFEPVHPRHVVVAHDAVERGRVGLEPRERVVDARLDRHVDRVPEPLQLRRREIRGRRVVVDHQHRHPSVHDRCRRVRRRWQKPVCTVRRHETVQFPVGVEPSLGLAHVGRV